MLSEDERSLLFVGVGYIAAVIVWALVLGARLEALLRAVRARDSALWAELGSPETARDVLQDPERRWRRFIGSGQYRKRLRAEGVDEIDDFRRRARVMIAVLAGAGALVLYRYWELLKPGWL
jgi:hypothetical protein